MQERRVERVRRGCAALGLEQTMNRVVMKHLLVDLRHHVLFCYVPKVRREEGKGKERGEKMKGMGDVGRKGKGGDARGRREDRER